MHRSILTLALLAGFLAAAIGLSWLLFRGAGSGDPAAALPASADAALIVPSVPTLLRDLSATRMAPAPGESGWELLAKIVSDLLGARGIEFEPDPGWLSKALRGSAAFAWVPSERAGSPPHLVLAFEIPSARLDVLALVEKNVLPEFAAQGLTWSRRTHRGHEYGYLRLPGTRASLCVASHKRLALVTVSGEAMRQALTALVRRDSSLASGTAFRRVRNDLRERSDVVAYLSGSLIRSLLAGRDSEEGRSRWLHAIAESAGVTAAGASITVTRRGLFRERVRILAPRIAGTIAGRIFASRPRPLSAAGLLPEGYPLYLGASFSDPGAAWAHLPEWFAPLLRQEPERLRLRLQGLQDFMGLDIRQDLLGALGEEVALALDPAGRKPPIVALRPSDEAAARRLLGRLDGLARATEAYHSEGLPKGAITTYTHEKITPHRPSYLFLDGALVLSDAPEPLAALAGRRAEGDRDPTPARGSPASFPSEKAHLLVSAETEELVRWLRGIAPGRGDEAAGSAWLERLRGLLPGWAGPLPACTASFRITREGLSGQWTAPLSPVILAALLAVSPLETSHPPLPPADSPIPEPEPEGPPQEPTPTP